MIRVQYDEAVVRMTEGLLPYLPREEARRFAEIFAAGKLKLTCLTKADPVQLGETVVTFGGGRGYPSGLTVGTVERLEDDPDGLTRWAVLTPATDLDSLSEVFVVTGFREAR